jgi:hypothetical protein
MLSSCESKFCQSISIVSLQGFDQSHRQYSAVMRFTLEDKEERLFYPERMCYRGSIDDWIGIGSWESLVHCAEKFIPTLGTDDFYELY